jgi:hypothetical protein
MTRIAVTDAEVKYQWITFSCMVDSDMWQNLHGSCNLAEPLLSPSLATCRPSLSPSLTMHRPPLSLHASAVYASSLLKGCLCVHACACMGDARRCMGVLGCTHLVLLPTPRPSPYTSSFSLPLVLLSTPRPSLYTSSFSLHLVISQGCSWVHGRFGVQTAWRRRTTA